MRKDMYLARCKHGTRKKFIQRRKRTKKKEETQNKMKENRLFILRKYYLKRDPYLDDGA